MSRVLTVYAVAGRSRAGHDLSPRSLKRTPPCPPRRLVLPLRSEDDEHVERSSQNDIWRTVPYKSSTSFLAIRGMGHLCPNGLDADWPVLIQAHAAYSILNLQGYGCEVAFIPDSALLLDAGSIGLCRIAQTWKRSLVTSHGARVATTPKGLRQCLQRWQSLARRTLLLLHRVIFAAAIQVAEASASFIQCALRGCTAASDLDILIQSPAVSLASLTQRVAGRKPSV